MITYDSRLPRIIHLLLLLSTSNKYEHCMCGLKMLTMYDRKCDCFVVQCGNLNVDCSLYG